jgi:hypothetical protein
MLRTLRLTATAGVQAFCLRSERVIKLINYREITVTVERIVGLVGIVIAIVAAFVSIPYVAFILLVAGLIVGFSIVREDHVRVIVTAMALAMFAHNFDAVPQLGIYLSMIVANGALLTAGAALMIMLRNIYARFMPMGK